MADQAKVLRGLMERCQTPSPSETTTCIAASKTRTIAVTSGKGGVGKSNIALNLSIALAETGSAVCLLDANLGLGNIDLLCGLNGYWNLSHVISGARRLQDVILDGPADVHLIPGASGITDVADCSPAARQDVLEQLTEQEEMHDFIIVDTGTGIHRSVREFLTASDLVLLVTTPETTAIADAYATIKSLSAGGSADMWVLVNQADSPQQAAVIIERLQQTSRIFLRADVASAGHIPRDPEVVRAVASRTPLLIGNPHSPAASAIQQLARRLKAATQNRPSHGTFFDDICRRQTRKAA